MKILLIGASGILGSRLYGDAIKKKWHVLGTYCSQEHGGLFFLDLRDKKSINKAFDFFDPDIVVLAASLTDVDKCESKQRLAEDINIKGTLNIVEKIKEQGAKLVFLSSDYIFNGEDGPYKEGDRVSPVNVYGRTKLEAEEAIKGLLKDYLIVRTSQLYGFDHRQKNFAVKIILNMRNNRKVSAAYDLYSTPTYAGVLSEGIVRLLEKNKQGIFHIAGAEFISRYEYVNKISDFFGLNKELIIRCKLSDLNLKAKRPKKAGLDTSKMREVSEEVLLNCEQGLGIFKKEIE